MLPYKESCVKFLTEVLSVLGIMKKERLILYGGMKVERVDIPQGSHLLEEGFDINCLIGLYIKGGWVGEHSE